MLSGKIKIVVILLTMLSLLVIGCVEPSLSKSSEE